MNVGIRRYQESDTTPLLEAVLESKSHLMPWMPWCHSAYGYSDAEQWVYSRESAWSSLQEFCFVVIDDSDAILGTCGVHRIDLRNGVGELGYWVRSSKLGQGIATAATALACTWAHAEHKIHRMELVISTRNMASRRVAEKAGAKLEGTLRKRIHLHGHWHDAHLYSILHD